MISRCRVMIRLIVLQLEGQSLLSPALNHVLCSKLHTPVHCTLHTMFYITYSWSLHCLCCAMCYVLLKSALCTQWCKLHTLECAALCLPCFMSLLTAALSTLRCMLLTPDQCTLYAVLYVTIHWLLHFIGCAVCNILMTSAFCNLCWMFILLTPLFYILSSILQTFDHSILYTVTFCIPLTTARYTLCCAIQTLYHCTLYAVL